MGEFLACGFGGQALAVLPDEGKAKVGEMAVGQGQVSHEFGVSDRYFRVGRG